MKPELHCRYPEKEPFAEMLVDLCDYIRADFSFIDGIEAMEGNGPTGGEKRFVGALIGGKPVCGGSRRRGRHRHAP